MKKGVTIIFAILVLILTAVLLTPKGDNLADTAEVEGFLIADGMPNLDKNTLNGTANVLREIIPGAGSSVNKGGFIMGTAAYYEQYGLHFDKSSGAIINASRSLSGNYTVPSQIDGIEVKSIDSYAFYNCKSIEKIFIPKSIESIEKYAFLNSVKEIEFEDGTDEIPEYACYNANNLEKVVVPDSVISIGKRAFCYCGNLSDFPKLSSLEKIGDYAFDGCQSMEKFFIPKTIKRVGYYVFRNSVKEVEFEEGTTKIPNYTCFYANTLERVVIPDSVTTIGYWAFSGCERLSDFPKLTSLTEINQHAFYDCISLEKMYIPKTIEIMEAYAFSNSVKEIEFEEGITKIPEAACCDASNLEKVIIPDSVTSIGDFAFCDCTRLSDVPKLTSVAEIGEYAFRGCELIEKMYIPKTIERIGTGAFRNSIKEVEFEEGITQIPDLSCYRVESLEKAIIPSSVEYIGISAFVGCNNLTIYCYPGSCAIDYAIRNNIPYELFEN